MTELQAFVAMLERSGAGRGLRTDHNPAGTAVLVECPDSDNVNRWVVCEFAFDGDGKLVAVESYAGEPG